MIKNKAGTTLIEVVVTLALIGILMVGFFGLYSTGIKLYSRANETTQSSMRSAANYEQKKNVTSISSHQISITFDGNGIDLPVKLIKYQVGKIVYWEVAADE